MTFYQRAVRYLWRKRSKSLLLCFIFLFVNTMILGTGMILHGAEHTEAELQKKTKAKVVCEMTDANAELTDAEYRKIGKLSHVQSVNRLGNQRVLLTEVMPVTKSDSTKADNMTVNLYSYDDLSQEGPFSDHTYQMTEGKLFTAGDTHQAVIHADFAALNGLQVGDTFSLQTGDGVQEQTVQTDVTICGLFLSGTEQQQKNDTLAVSRVENQIYLDQTSYGELFGGTGIYKLSVYIDQPKELAHLAKQLQNIFPEKAEVTTSDALYQQMKAPIAQMTGVVRLMQILTLLTGFFVVSLLLCMWMRSRQKEMAVLISLGEAKICLFLQAFLESAVLFLLAAGCSCALGIAAADQIQKFLFTSLASDMTLTIAMKGKDVIQLLGMGGIVVVIAVLLSILPVLCSSPRDILSRMEG